MSQLATRQYTRTEANFGKDGQGPMEKVHKMRQLLYKNINIEASDHVENAKNGKGKTNEGTIQIQHGIDGWDELWREKLTPWDLGRPTPVLQSELKKCGANLLEFQEHAKAKRNVTLRSLIPGCGAGYDLTTVANHHEKSLAQITTTNTSVDSLVIGLDVSSKSLSCAKQSVSNILDDNNDCIEERGTVIMLCEGDFFGDTQTWEHFDSINCGSNKNRKHLQEYKDPQFREPFDFIFDYTFFCALPPDLRQQWASRMSTLLKPRSGRLLTLIFPILPDENKAETYEPQGPPYPVTVEEYKCVLEPFGFRIVQGMGPYESTDTVKERVSKELVCWWELKPKTN